MMQSNSESRVSSFHTPSALHALTLLTAYMRRRFVTRIYWHSAHYPISPGSICFCIQACHAGVVCEVLRDIESWSRHTIPKTQDDSLGDSVQIHFTQRLDASAKTDGPITSLQGDVKRQFLQVIFWKYFESGLTKKIVKKKIVIQSSRQFFQNCTCASLCFGWINLFRYLLLNVQRVPMFRPDIWCFRYLAASWANCIR